MSTTAVLRQNWRKLSSTDNLQAYAADNEQLCSQHPRKGFAARTKLLGCTMLAAAATLISAALLMLVCKVLPPSAYSSLLRAVQQDQYYIFLVPLMLPMLLIAVTVNWFSLKLFKHNS